MALMIPDRPLGSVEDLQWYVQDLVQALGAGAQGKLILGVSVGTSETPIAHGHETTPQAVFVLPQSSSVVFRSRAPDAQRVYLQASVATTVDLLVIP